MSDLRKKIGTITPFLQVLGIFLLNARLRTGTSYARAMSIWKFSTLQSQYQAAVVILYCSAIGQKAGERGNVKTTEFPPT